MNGNIKLFQEVAGKSLLFYNLWLLDLFKDGLMAPLECWVLLSFWGGFG